MSDTRFRSAGVAGPAGPRTPTAEHLDTPGRADSYRAVAAGVSVLCRRARGNITPTETLILARI
ncbi:hypothetical protein [Streptomyces hyaluromycini]|uniref:hypothetical protein n=1 Tax=Streptomyces hyaluromycini TaxID=1377993 RepID=UPI000B5CEC20|nr:hypothetical protein [Streptomyces hyaluromycini]